MKTARMLTGIAALAGALLSTGRAHAAPTPVLAAEADLRDALDRLDSQGSRPFSIQANPAMSFVAFGPHGSRQVQASGNVEYVPVTHLGLVGSPRVSFAMPAWVGEVGMRYWTSKRREPSGFFAGPSLVYGQTRGAPVYGLALDCGVQTIFESGLTVGAGVGVQYLRGTIGNSSLEVGPLEGDTTVSNAVLPRLLFSIGYSL